MRDTFPRWRCGSGKFAYFIGVILLFWCNPATAQAQSTTSQPELNDVHFHLTNYVQQGTDIHDFLAIMGTPNQEKYLRVYRQYEPLWNALSFQTSEDVRKGNYERLFDEARKRVRTWEAANSKSNGSTPSALEPASELP
jgi:hypothetical protein